MNNPMTNSSSKKKAAAEWTPDDIDALVFEPYSTGDELPSYKELASYVPEVDLNPEVQFFFDAPSAPSASLAATALMEQAANMYRSPSVSTYVSDSDRELLSLFRALEQKAKSIVAASGSNNKLRDAAVRLTNFLLNSGRFSTCRLMEIFMLNPDMYSRKARAEPIDTESDNKKQKQGKFDEFIDKSVELLKNAMTRAKWVLEIEQRNAGKQSDDKNKTLERVLGVLLKDTEWMTESILLLHNAKQRMDFLINTNKALFERFKEISKRGVQWPHSTQVKRQIERAGFVFRPKFIERDRFVCDFCEVEVSGWRIWHNPWHFHNWSKQHPFVSPAGALSNPFAANAGTTTRTVTTTAAPSLQAQATVGTTASLASGSTVEQTFQYSIVGMPIEESGNSTTTASVATAANAGTTAGMATTTAANNKTQSKGKHKRRR